MAAKRKTARKARASRTPRKGEIPTFRPATEAAIAAYASEFEGVYGNIIETIWGRRLHPFLTRLVFAQNTLRRGGAVVGEEVDPSLGFTENYKWLKEVFDRVSRGEKIGNIWEALSRLFPRLEERRIKASEQFAKISQAALVTADGEFFEHVAEITKVVKNHSGGFVQERTTLSIFYAYLAAKKEKNPLHFKDIDPREETTYYNDFARDYWMHWLDWGEEELKLPICPSAYDVAQKLSEESYSGEDHKSFHIRMERPNLQKSLFSQIRTQCKKMGLELSKSAKFEL